MSRPPSWSGLSPQPPNSTTSSHRPQFDRTHSRTSSHTHERVHAHAHARHSISPPHRRFEPVYGDIAGDRQREIIGVGVDREREIYREREHESSLMRAEDVAMAMGRPSQGYERSGEYAGRDSERGRAHERDLERERAHERIVARRTSYPSEDERAPRDHQDDRDHRRVHGLGHGRIAHEHAQAYATAGGGAYGTLKRFSVDERASHALALEQRGGEDWELAREREIEMERRREVDHRLWRDGERGAERYLPHTSTSRYTSDNHPRRSSHHDDLYSAAALTHPQNLAYEYAPTRIIPHASAPGYQSEHDREIEEMRARGKGLPITMPSPPGHGQRHPREEYRIDERDREELQRRGESVRGSRRYDREEPIDVDRHDERDSDGCQRRGASGSRRVGHRDETSPRSLHAYMKQTDRREIRREEAEIRRARDRDILQAHTGGIPHRIPVAVQPQVIHGLPPGLQGAQIQAFQPYYPSDAFEEQRGGDWPLPNASPHIAHGRDRGTPMSSSRSGDSLRDRRSSAVGTASAHGSHRTDRYAREHDRHLEPSGSHTNGWQANQPPRPVTVLHGLALLRAHFDQEVQRKAERDRLRFEEHEQAKAMMLAQLVLETRRAAASATNGTQAANGLIKPASSKKAVVKPAEHLDDELMGLAEEDAESMAEGNDQGENGVPESSPAPLDPEQIALRAALDAHESMAYPTKGMRNKDGTLRKKPGPPKGIKKGQSKRQFLEENAKDRLLGRVREDDDGSDNASGSGTGKNKKRRLNAAMTSEMGSQVGGSRQSSPVRRDQGGPGMDVDNDIEGILGSESDGRDHEPGAPPPNPPPLHAAQSDPALQDRYAYEEPEFDLYPVPPRWQPNPTGFSQPPVVPIALDGREYESPPPDANVINNNTAFYRADCAERMQWLLWTDIVQKQIPQAYKYVRDTISNKQDNAKKVAGLCVRAPRRQAAREKKSQKDQVLRARKAAREAIAFWRKNEREEVENRKRAEKEALEKAKAAEAAKEKEMAARRLNYLLSSGEMYSRLMKKKIRTDEAMDSAAASINGGEEEPASEADEDDDEDGEEDLDLEADGEMTEEAIQKQAAKRAKSIMQDKKRRAAAFDKQVMAEREEVLGEDTEEGADKVALTTEGLDFQNPLAGENNLAITQPKMLMATLKDYQLKGLSWLGNLYESGINGILADEMGLGKTIQSISLLAYLAEQHNIWGPFLVVAPASTVHNWQQELTRFVPRLKALPYWGIEKDRKILRRDWNRKSLTFTEDAPFHIVVTSYEMAVRDEAAFQKVRWQYMILDEAQAVKNATSLRWQTLLTLKTRNRLLLTGTPIQNSMNELWALLHFIMPELFSSLNDFTEWFSKGIEGASGMRDNNLSSKQLKRLHDVLRPFMLRRVKKNVQSELGEKIEIDLVVDLSPRQRSMYRALRTNANVRALLASAVETSDTAAKSKTLMNIVMQFRKVCGHPDLFERADVASPYSWGTFSGSGELMRQHGLYCPDSCRNPITFEVPRLVWNERVGVVSERSQAGSDTRYLGNLMNIWNDEYIARSSEVGDSPFGFLSLTKAAPSDYRRRARQPFWQNIFACEEEVKELCRKPWTAGITTLGYQSGMRSISLNSADGTSPNDIARASWDVSWLSRQEARFYLEKAVSPPIHTTCSSRSFERQRDAAAHDIGSELALYGLPGTSVDDRHALERARAVLPGLPPRGLLGSSPLDQTPTTAMRFPSMKRLIFDSAKLARLDSLLRELKAGGHRVLIYFQMTKMMGIVEEYLIYRQHKYLRLDGSTPIGDRRDLVGAWQTNPELFVFMLSTKAGGLGINLTAADTVIFYDHDWNPSSDSQAMDRAHRVGQTRQVTVYRLICRHTIDERILQLARTKKDVQDIVVGTKTLAEVDSQKEIVSLLLDDEDEDDAMGGGGGSSSFGGPGFGNSFNATNFDDEDDEGFFATKKGAGGAKTIEDGLEEVLEGTGEGGNGEAAGGKGKGKKRKAGGMAGGEPAPKKKTVKKVKIAEDIDGSGVGEPKPKKTRAPRVPKGKKAGSPLKLVVTPADSPSLDADGDLEMAGGERLAPLE